MIHSRTGTNFLATCLASSTSRAHKTQNLHSENRQPNVPGPLEVHNPHVLPAQGYGRADPVLVFYNFCTRAMTL